MKTFDSTFRNTPIRFLSYPEPTLPLPYTLLPPTCPFCEHGISVTTNTRPRRINTRVK
jgi:hypothetical protein